MKSYAEQNYPMNIDVIVHHGKDGHFDAIKGLNRGHALWLARKNWPDADEIEVVS